MLNLMKIVELLISLESIIISTMLPIYISIPSKSDLLEIINLPITWQIPTIIFLTIFFSGKIVNKAFTIYLLIGLFLLPVFYDGGSIGYLLTPNFGYLLGIIPLIRIIDKLNNGEKITIKKFFKISILALIIMHLVGIIYTGIQLLLFNKLDLIIYNIGKFTFSKILFEILLLFPIFILLNLFKKKKFS